MNRSKTKQFLAICWDSSRFHFLLAKKGRKNKVAIVTTGSKVWQSGVSMEEIVDTVKDELRKNKIRNPSLLVGISRSQSDVLSVDVPPANDRELPMIVRNEVARQLPDLGDEDVVDFFANGAVQSGQPSSVVAGVLRRTIVDDIGKMSSLLGLPTASIVLRPYCVASLFNRNAGSQFKQCLVLNRLDHSVDMLIVKNGNPIFGRTARIESSGAPENLAQDLATEIMRTIAAVPHGVDEPAAEIERVCLFGALEPDDELHKKLSECLSLPLTILDPFDGVESEENIGDPTRPVAALIGMVRDFVAEDASIDFANPKKPPKPPNRVRQFGFYGIAASAVIGIVSWTFASDVREIREKNDAIQVKIDDAKLLLNKYRKNTIVVDAVQAWRRNEVNWLDEFNDISRRFPGNSEAVVDRVSFSPYGQFDGSIAMSVRAREPSVVLEMESSLRDKYRRVNSKRISQGSDDQPFPCHFETNILVRSRPQTAYAIPSIRNASPANRANAKGPSNASSKLASTK